MKLYLLIPLLIITSCGYDEVRCYDTDLEVKLDNFTEEEKDSIILQRYAGTDFATKTDSFLLAKAGNEISQRGTNSFTLTFLKLGITYQFSDIQYAGKKTERRKKVIDLGGSYRPDPCFNNVASVTLDGKKIFFDTKRTSSVTLERK